MGGRVLEIKNPKYLYFTQKFFLINRGDCPPYFSHFVIYKGGYGGEGVFIPTEGGLIHRGCG